MTQTLLERAARALYERDTDGRYQIFPNGAAFSWDELTHESRLPYIADARAVLIAIREPSEDWVEKAMESEYVVSWGDYKEFWQAMIDAALGE